MELKKQMIKAAEELFRTEGLQFTMQDVAAALHISKKTIYTVYSSKETLLIDMIDDLFSDIHNVKAEIAASEKSIEERIRAVIVALPEQYTAIDFRMLDVLEEKYPTAASRVKEHLENNWEPTVALIEEGIAAGCIRPVPINVLKKMITASIECFLSGDKSGGYADTLDAMIDIIMNGIKVR